MFIVKAQRLKNERFFFNILCWKITIDFQSMKAITYFRFSFIFFFFSTFSFARKYQILKE